MRPRPGATMPTADQLADEFASWLRAGSYPATTTAPAPVRPAAVAYVRGRHVDVTDWSGPAADRPGLMARPWQVAGEPLVATWAPHPPEPEPQVLEALHLVDVHDLPGGLGLVLGRTRTRPDALADGWVWLATRTVARMPDGTVVENVALRLRDQESGRRAALAWTRRLLSVGEVAARWCACWCAAVLAHPFATMAEVTWPLYSGWVRQLDPFPSWRSELAMLAEADGPARVVKVSEIKAAIRTSAAQLADRERQDRERDEGVGTMTNERPICAECAVDEDPRAWCDCNRSDGEQCRGPCRTRAHDPARCPFLSAMVPTPTRWELVKAGDVIYGKDGGMLLVMGKVGDADDESRPAGLITWSVARGPQTLQAPGRNPDHPVPILVPYAERAALLTLRENGVRGRMVDRPAGGAG